MVDSLRHVVPTGIAGLDLALGGGVVLVEKLAGVTPSTTVLVRGGPGAGKTLLALSLTKGLIGNLGEDYALYACVELLPRELRAQALGLDPSLDVALVEDGLWPAGRIVAANVVTGPGEDLANAIETAVPALIDRASVERGRSPSVLVIDAATSGYGLGANAERALVDALSKLSAQQGLVLIVVEETSDLTESSPWPFAFDHVFELALSNDQRTLSIPKARFSAAVRGPHLVRFGSPTLVFPALEAYATVASLEGLARSAVPIERQWSRLYRLTDSSDSRWTPWPARAYVVGSNEPIVRAFAADLLYTSHSNAVDVSVELGASELDRRDPTGSFPDSVVIAGRARPEEVLSRVMRVVDQPHRKVLGRIFCGDLRGVEASSRRGDWRLFFETLGDVCRALRVPLILWDSSPARFDPSNVVIPVRDLPPLAGLADFVCELVPTSTLKAIVVPRAGSFMGAQAELSFEKLFVP